MNDTSTEWLKCVSGTLRGEKQNKTNDKTKLTPRKPNRKPRFFREPNRNKKISKPHTTSRDVSESSMDILQVVTQVVQVEYIELAVTGGHMVYQRLRLNRHYRHDTVQRV